jgi:hypothetical protein
MIAKHSGRCQQPRTLTSWRSSLTGSRSHSAGVAAMISVLGCAKGRFISRMGFSAWNACPSMARGAVVSGTPAMARANTSRKMPRLPNNTSCLSGEWRKKGALSDAGLGGDLRSGGRVVSVFAVRDERAQHRPTFRAVVKWSFEDACHGRGRRGLAPVNPIQRQP